MIDFDVVVRGGGDLATAVIHKLHRCGFSVLVLEAEQPSAIRRYVSFAEAVYTKKQTVEGVTAVLVSDLAQAMREQQKGNVPLLIDPKGDVLSQIHPSVLVDAILAKCNLGTNMDMADMVIGLGPGFTAKKDVHFVIETKRGHDLGRILSEGCATPNTGVPGVIGGYGKERVIHANTGGVLRNKSNIGDWVKKGQVIAEIDGIPVLASIDGVLRGLIRDGYAVTKGFKIADIDPRVEEQKNCYTISDKARCIAGGVLECIFWQRSFKWKRLE